MIFQYSFSKLKDYETCPFLFKAKHVDKMRFEQTPDMKKGSVKHDLFAGYAAKCFEAKMTQLFDQWKTIAGEFLRSAGLPAEMEQEVLESFHDFVSGMEFSLDGFAGAELKLAIDTQGNACTWEDGFFRVIIDRLYLRGDTAEIRDYKTGYGMDADKFQLEIYAWVLTKIYPHLNMIRGGFDYTQFGRNFDFDITRERIEEVEASVINRINGIEKDAAFKPIVCAYCERCPAWGVCPAMKKRTDLLRQPQKKDEAQLLIAEYWGLERRRKELLRLLKGYVVEAGSVEFSDLVAQNKPLVKHSWNVPALLNWAKEKECVQSIEECLSVDKRKIKKLDRPEVFTFAEEKVSMRFGVAKAKGGDEDDD